MTELAAYFPQDLLDEVMPPDRPSPDAWIVAGPAGAPALDLTVYAFEPARRSLRDGEIVKFARRFDYGVATLRLSADGYSIDAPMPAEADQCCGLDGWQQDTLASDVAELVQQFREADADPGAYRVSYYRFEDALPYRFDAAARRFDKVDA